MRILLVEDDPILAELVSELLNESNDAACARSAPEAFDALASGPRYDVVLLDLQLNRDRGEDVVERLRAAGKRVPPLVILSAQPQRELRAAAARIGAAAILQKPATLKQIEEAVNAACEAES